MPVRRGVRVARQQRDDVARARPDVRRIDAAVGAHEPVVGLGDDHAVRHPDDAFRLAQHDLDLARVAVMATRAFERLRPRLDGRQVDDGALGLRHDLLGDDEHVVVAEREVLARAASASAMSLGRSSPGTISPIPSIGTTTTRSATDRLGRLGLGEQQILRRVDVERQRTVEQLDLRAGRPAGRRGGPPCCRRRTGSR